MTRIERIDITDDEAFAAFHDVYVRAHERDIDLPYSAIENRVNLRSDAYGDVVVLLARDGDGTGVGGGVAEMPLRDNTDFAYLDVFVVPEARRCGHGTAIIGALDGIATDAGRTILFAEAVWEVGTTDPAQPPFFEGLGFRCDLRDAVRALPLPATLPPLTVADGYTVHTWRGPCPDAWVEEYAGLRRLLGQESPSGDIGLENEFWDVERVRREESDWAEQQRTPQVSIAMSDGGDLAGHTQLLFPADGPDVLQWDTLVLPSHRGHGLGLALKIATMHAADDLLAGRRRVVTFNAASNEPMIRVNEALGFRQIASAAEYVRKG